MRRSAWWRSPPWSCACLAITPAAATPASTRKNFLTVSFLCESSFGFVTDGAGSTGGGSTAGFSTFGGSSGKWRNRSEEHTSELQSQSNLVCRLLLEKKKKSKSGDENQ